jgi:hypothetical protein
MVAFPSKPPNLEAALGALKNYALRAPALESAERESAYERAMQIIVRIKDLLGRVFAEELDVLLGAVCYKESLFDRSVAGIRCLTTIAAIRSEVTVNALGKLIGSLGLRNILSHPTTEEE